MSEYRTKRWYVSVDELAVTNLNSLAFAHIKKRYEKEPSYIDVAIDTEAKPERRGLTILITFKL